MYTVYRNVSGGNRFKSKGGSRHNSRKPGDRFGRHDNRKRFNRGGQRNSFGRSIDISKFINKAKPAERAESYIPQHAFADFALDARLKANIAAHKYVTPTPIQDKAIPEALRGTDVVGIANTGTGKTAAFLIPLINKILLDHRQKVLILTPTRELAIQIDQEFRGFARGFNMRSVVCVGGASIGKQISDLRHAHNFIIGTPGRIEDLMKRKFINLSNFSTVVLDEADRMLDMGFIGSVKMMLAAMPEKRHTLFFTATLSREIESLIATFLSNPIKISVKTGETADTVEQDIIRVENGKNKLDLLHDLLIQKDFNKVLVFGKTKHGVERLSKDLSKRGFKVESIHGNKNHSKRQKALELFKNNHIQVLIATDVAARGLDISGVSHVINYDIPATYEDYIHRIGRTGRAGNAGKALTFIG